jgi:hypothetical protein
MQYRLFGKNREKASILGMGCMRLPRIDNDVTKIDEDKAISLIRYAIDRGINYVDTAWSYHGGTSEIVLGKALKDGYRDKVIIADKLPSWLIESRGDMDRYLDQQLEKLQVDCIDAYLLHNMNEKRWKNLKDNGIFDFIEQIKKEGKIRNIGFSFHDHLPVFKEIVVAYPWDFCQIQYNIIDENYQAGKQGLKYAAERNIDVVIMEPLRGGALVNDLGEDMQNAWKEYHGGSPVKGCFDWLWNQPEIKVVLSGMNTIEQVKENILSSVGMVSGSLNIREKKALERIQKIYEKKIVVNCTNCQYCIPCPYGVDIPLNLKFLNTVSMLSERKVQIKAQYGMLVKEDKRASQCVQCGVCIEKCPQNINISEELKKVVAEFEDADPTKF